MDDNELLERLRLIQIESLRMRAEVGALRFFIATRAQTFGMDEKQLWAEVDQLKEKMHAKLLLALENKDPGTAANLDDRPWHPDED